MMSEVMSRRWRCAGFVVGLLVAIPALARTQPADTPSRDRGTCPEGQVVRAVERNGTVTCVVVGDITGVIVGLGSGLEGGGTSGDVSIRLATNVLGAFDLSNLFGVVSQSLPDFGPGFPPPLPGPGRRFIWYPAKAAFRAGRVTGDHWDDINMGQASVAFGQNTIASGESSVAMGQNVTAGGANSVALGFNVSASTDGTFMFGDHTAGDLFTFQPNQFLVRASGGTSFYSNTALTTGVELLPNASAWASPSDVNLKEHFRDLDGDEVLAKLARMPIREWSYKAQDTSIRHVGPTAQDFHGAFGLGEHPLKISTIDADGIALRAVQALEARTRALTDENRVLRERLERIEQLLRSR